MVIFRIFSYILAYYYPIDVQYTIDLNNFGTQLSSIIKNILQHTNELKFSRCINRWMIPWDSTIHTMIFKIRCKHFICQMCSKCSSFSFHLFFLYPSLFQGNFEEMEKNALKQWKQGKTTKRVWKRIQKGVWDRARVDVRIHYGSSACNGRVQKCSETKNLR